MGDREMQPTAFFSSGGGRESGVWNRGGGGGGGKTQIKDANAFFPFFLPTATPPTRDPRPFNPISLPLPPCIYSRLDQEEEEEDVAISSSPCSTQNCVG